MLTSNFIRNYHHAPHLLALSSTLWVYMIDARVYEKRIATNIEQFVY